jgi:2-amino-4-hydroxy-6-hydroxymethyldihydropteridine diphosphokinase
MLDRSLSLPSPTQAGIGLGSNLGNSDLIFRRALHRLQELHLGSKESFLISSFYKTAPVDCSPDSPDFLNAVVQLETSLSSYDLIDFLQKIESDSGRPWERIKNSPRTLDLDLLYHGSIVLNTDRLILPHPKILEREFVLRPLSDIAPHLILPGWEKAAKEYLLYLKK